MTNIKSIISSLPHFSEIKPADIESVIETILDNNKNEIDSLCNRHKQGDDISWEELNGLQEKLDNHLSSHWSPVRHLNSVMNSDELRKAHDACIPKLSRYGTELAQHSGLYEIYQKIRNRQEFEFLPQADKKIIDNALLKFKLNGITLDDAKKELFKQHKQQLAELKTQFEHNILDATQAWQLHIKRQSDLAGLPEYVQDMGKQKAKSEKEPGWLFTLDAPSYLSIMMYSDVRAIRKEMYEAYVTRASDQGPDAGKYDNSEIMLHLLEHRTAMAKLLGYENYAELSIADKMAETTTDVIKFLNELVAKSKPQAEKECHELNEFAKKELSIEDFSAWDTAYVAEKLKQKEYGLSQQELKPYFPAPKVIAGMFEIVHKLYGIEIEQLENIDVWHPDVNFYVIKDQSGDLRGGFYLDLYARSNKRGGAWMDECLSRVVNDQIDQLPIAYLTCNLTAPVAADPALLTHDEVTTLFHEFGHGLHHMLSQINRLFVSGINGVEWDAVELPSQFMENWCWEKAGLDCIASHYQTNEALPEALFKKMLRAKNFQSAMAMVRQLEFALFDFRLHMEYGTEQFHDVQTLLNEVRDQVSVIQVPEFNRFQHGFAHIFSGGYSAGYYSYKWAEVLSADAFSRFEDEGIFNQKTGQAFLTEILEKGGSEPAATLFMNFIGRKPSINALLKHSGLA
ncbi:MAG: M3 family metallopeptidase [Gammaproteobacteria bacterium]|nr:M3 family metallopeptidase [Gammaproteobacteria bacterium]